MLGWVVAVVAGSAAAPQSADEVVTFRPPVAGPLRVTHPFLAPPEPWSAGHRGVDLASDVGTPLVSPAAGIVTFVGEVAGRGVVTVTHPGGLRSSLEPVVPTVAVGAAVAAGDTLGTLAGNGSHCAPASCVHWGVRRGTTYLDPLGTLGAPGPIVLLSERPPSGGAGPRDERESPA
ncbi:peptidoglycan DD-metalloendopeptidase family protein [Cellulomonas sp. URHB0016]